MASQPNPLSAKVAEALLIVRKVPSFDSSSGDTVDVSLAGRIARAIGAKTSLSPQQWKEDKWTGLRKHMLSVCKRPKDDPGPVHIVFGPEVLDEPFEKPVVVRQPCGSQNWPDMAILYRFRALPIEFKSQQGDKITWNSGLPRIDGIYVFNGRLPASAEGSGVAETTFFLGQHVLDDASKAYLLEASEHNHRLAVDYNERLAQIKSGWSLYPRPMYNYSGKFLLAAERQTREDETLEFVRGFSWERPLQIRPSAQGLVA